MPNDSPQLRDNIIACLPSLVIDAVAAESGQRVVYFAHFDDEAIPADVPIPEDVCSDNPGFLHGWGGWGRIVVKVVSGAGSEELSRLQAETQILADVRPANFPKLLYSNLFVENPVTEERLPERLYVSVEEFIESKPLVDVVHNYKGNESAVVGVALGVANALYPLWMHPKKFVHRDIKPANVLIRPSGGVVVIDLGIVRETGAVGVTRDGWGMAPLTPGYAAPEQISNDKNSISFKSDFFSIGVLMYHLLAGVQPFETRAGMAAFEIALQVESLYPPPLSEIVGATPGFSEFVEKAMKKAPWQRMRTPGVFVEELEKLNSSLGA